MNATPGKNPKPVCELLPPVARQILQQAALTPIPDSDPMARKRAIERAMSSVRHLFPQYFNKE